MLTASIADLEQVPALAEVVERVAAERGRTDPRVVSALLTLLPTQCGSDGVLYRRQCAAERAAEGYERAIHALRPGTRFYWLVVPDGSGWRWWGVVLPRDEAE